MTDVKIVAPMNIGKGIKWNSQTKQYDVAIASKQPIGFNEQGELVVLLHEKPDNLLRIMDGKLYYGQEPEKEYKTQYVDYQNGDDNNAGTKQAPIKTIGKALSNVKRGTAGSVIYIKEGQTHYLTDDRTTWVFDVLGSVMIRPYGENLDRLSPGWFSDHLGYRTHEPVETSEEWEPYRPRIAFRTTDTRITNSRIGEKYNHRFVVRQAVTLHILGVEFVPEYSSSAARNVWDNSAVVGSGVFICTGCLFDNTPHAIPMYLASSVIGALTVNVRYLKLKGTEKAFATGQFVLSLFMSYIINSRTLNDSALQPMYFRQTSSVQEIKDAVRNPNPFNPVYNQ